MSHHIVEFKDVCFSYPDGTEALRGVSFRITHGEAVGIIGANGAGKSTLLFHMNGCLMPSSGTVLIGEFELNKKTRADIRKRVGLVFQNPDDQLFMPTVYEDVAFGPLNLGLSEDVVRARVEEALATVGCYRLKDRPPHHLSMGQRRAVSIAAVIAMQPDILVMDEPSADLDPRSRRQLISLLKGFTHTKIIASHDLDLIMDTCTRCIVLSDGRITADGSAEEILMDEGLLVENGLELPLSLKYRCMQQEGAFHD
jgi:cobalt/nickel transport system ATP-binding protein